MLNIVRTFFWFFLAMFSSTGDGLCDSISVLQGRVTDTEGNPIPFAKITVIAMGDSLTRYSVYSDYQPDNGTYRVNLPSAIVSNVENDDESPPHPIILNQNSPNPFNSSTTITYELHESGQVALDIFSVTGQKIRLIDSGIKSAGLHKVTWDGCDTMGRSVGSGVYIYQIRSRGRSLARKMVLLDGGGNAQYPAHYPLSAVGKPAINFTVFSVIVQKEGYEEYREDNLRLPSGGGSLIMDIRLKNNTTPGDFFHLEIGNSWTYVTTEKNIHGNTSWKFPVLYKEWSTAIVDTVRYDGNLYYVFDRCTPFLPKSIDGIDTGYPVVRITKSGDLVMRALSTDNLIYNFSTAENQPSEPNILDIYTEVIKQECVISTPAGTYTDCRKIRISSGGIYFIWISRSAGPVYYSTELSGSEPDTFLEKADIGSRRFGVTKGARSGDTVTDNDLTEMYRLIMDPSWFEWHTTMGEDFLYEWNPSGDFVITGEPLDPMLFPEHLPVPFEFISDAEIDGRAEKYWEYWYFKVQNIAVGDSTVSVDIDFLFDIAKDYPGAILAGGGFTVEFAPRLGMWISRTGMRWISKPTARDPR